MPLGKFFGALLDETNGKEKCKVKKPWFEIVTIVNASHSERRSFFFFMIECYVNR